MLPVILINGYKYDPIATNKNNPYTTLFKEWRKQLKEFHVIDYGWFSVPLSLTNVLKAWSNGHYNTYRWAWHLAKKESNSLFSVIEDIGECNLIAHSLGTRVALQAIKNKANVHTAIFLNGAEYSDTAANIAELSQTNFHNMYVKTDDVLKRLGKFAPPFFGNDIFIGQAGLKIKLNNWKDYQLDSEKTRLWGKQKGYDLRGDNPNSIGDHHYSYTWTPNWELYRDILAKKLL